MTAPTQTQRTIFKPEWKHIPPLGCSEEDAKAFVKRVINDKSRARRWNLLRHARNLQMFKGPQWFEVPDTLISDASGGYRFKDVSRATNSVFPMPEDNLIKPGVLNEVSRLVRKEYVPNTLADAQRPDFEAAARLSKELLLHDLQVQRWADIRHGLALDLMVGGTCTARSIWDEAETDMVPVASPDAAECPNCSTKLASRRIPTQQARMGIPAFPGGPPIPLIHREEPAIVPVPREPGRPEEMEMNVCPTCPEPTELQPFSPGAEDIEGEPDIFGRPMGQMVPRGNGIMEMVSQFDYYPENGGVNVEPATVKVHGQKTVRELEWLMVRAPEFREKLKPQQSSELLRCAPSGVGRMGSAGDEEGVYDHHAALLEVYVDPLPLEGLEEGRRFWVCGEDLLKNDSLIVEVEAPDEKMRKVQRVKYSSARFEVFPGQFWGITPVDDAIPLQRRLNELDAQVTDIRERGAPWVAVPMGTEIHQSEEDTGAMRFVEIEALNPNWTPKDGLINGQPLTGTAYMAERDRIKQAIEEKIGPQPIEIGVNQPSVKSGEHAQIMAEEASQKRGPRERDLVNLAETIWAHHLEITWAFRKEQGEMEVEKAAGQFERKSYLGTDLLGQTRVKIEAQSNFEKTLYQTQAAERAYNSGLYGDLSTDDVTREKVIELMNLPKLKEDRSIQIKRAEQVWSEFLKDAKSPTVDESVQDMWIWFQVFGKRWMTDEAIEIQAEAGWDEVVKKISGWERKLMEAEALDIQQRAIYEGYPPEQWQQIQQEGTQKALAAAQAQPGVIPQVPPAPPQSGQFLPENMADRLIQLWKPMIIPPPPPMPPEAQMALEQGLVPPPPPPEELEPNVEALLNFYAVIQQCRLGAERKKAQAMGGAPVVAAPGGGRSAAGTEPIGGAVQPAAGASALSGAA